MSLECWSLLSQLGRRDGCGVGSMRDSLEELSPPVISMIQLPAGQAGTPHPRVAHTRPGVEGLCLSQHVPEPPRICLPCSTLRAQKGCAFSVPSKSTHLALVTTPAQDPRGEGIPGIPHTGLAKKFIQVFRYIL